MPDHEARARELWGRWGYSDVNARELSDTMAALRAAYNEGLEDAAERCRQRFGMRVGDLASEAIEGMKK